MRWWISLLAVLVLAAAAPSAYTADGRVVFPADYRSWVYLTTGSGMSYSPRAQAAGGGSPPFDNVFVKPDAYRAFVATGHWPDKTTFVIEVRASREKGSINKHGHFQGEVLGYDVELRDDARFPDEKWKWMTFGAPDANGAIVAAQTLPKSAACYVCHTANAAVDKSFVQFYPTLLPIASAKHTLNAAYAAAEAAERR